MSDLWCYSTEIFTWEKYGGSIPSTGQVLNVIYMPLGFFEI